MKKINENYERLAESAWLFQLIRFLSQINNSKIFLGRMFAVGLSQGPPHHYWYMYLDRILPKADLRTIALKIIMDQIFAAPFFAITFFFGMGILEDKRTSECWNEFVRKFPAVYLVNFLNKICNSGNPYMEIFSHKSFRITFQFLHKINVVRVG